MSFPTSSSKGGQGTVLELTRWKDIAIPWRKQSEMDKHKMEDIFLDEIAAQDLDDDYHFDNNGDFQFDSVMDVVTPGGNENQEQYPDDDNTGVEDSDLAP